MNRRGLVVWNEIPAGIIEETESGYEFRYLDSWLASPRVRPVSLTLPITNTPYVSKTFFSIFRRFDTGGVAPRNSLKKLEAQRKDRMGLLLAVCRDCIGAISVVPEVGS